MKGEFESHWGCSPRTLRIGLCTRGAGLCGGKVNTADLGSAAVGSNPTIITRGAGAVYGSYGTPKLP